ncbi:hypothetical protein CHS0354_035115 [Potamilus streckersoni]|uniref:Uncharacterized protein n=1 Tax=Potamilus streckersoni TaxID=2493646 RepID=A0AAE0TJ12_9BIVA|nr:hypothetical protein CHS0354_035115 [Potamilus streckersoni]
MIIVCVIQHTGGLEERWDAIQNSPTLSNGRGNGSIVPTQNVRRKITQLRQHESHDRNTAYGRELWFSVFETRVAHADSQFQNNFGLFGAYSMFCLTISMKKIVVMESGKGIASIRIR